VNPVKSELDLPDDAEVSFVPMDAVGELGGLRLDEVRAVDDVYNGYTYFRDGDVVIAKITPCFENGKGALAAGLASGVGFGTTELHVVRPTETLDPRFVFYMTIAHDFRCFGTAEMLGAGGQKRVPERFLKDWRPAIPLVETQRRIAAFLDEKTAQIDGLIAKKRAMLDRLAEKRQATITQAVTKGLRPAVPMKDSGIDWLGQIPDQWKVIALNKVTTKITNGYVGPTRDLFVNEGVRYIQSLHIKSNQIIFGNDFFVEEEWSLAHAKSILKTGDVLVVQTGDIGQAACVTPEHEGCNCHALIICSPAENQLSGQFLAWLLNSDYGQEFLHLVKTGALHPHLNCGNVKFFQVLIPPLREQAVIVDYIDRQTSAIARVAQRIEASLEQLAEYRSALITAAVTGQIEELR
jgi:type I restriction enzyme S subunit